MKYIKYIIMVIASLVMTVACTDEGPESMLTSNADVTISKLTPTGVVFSVNDNSPTKASSVYVVITDASGDCVEIHQPDIARVDFSRYYEDFFVPTSTYNYKVSLEYGGESVHMSSLVEIASGSFTVPTVDEYFKETFGESTMEVSLVTSNSALLTVKLPDGVTFNAARPTLLYSTSPDFADAKSVTAEDMTAEDIGYSISSCSFNLVDLEEQTTYYVKVVGDLRCDNDGIWPDDAELTLNPGSFTTLSVGEVVSGAKCKLSVDYMLDYFGSVTITLPETWSFYKEYSNDPVVCEVIYSTDPNFEQYEVVAGAKWSDNKYACPFTGLTPETTYYMALKGNFSCDAVNQVFKDHIIPADNSFTTTHANQIEMVDGHACVDLGLSVKWAVDNVTQGAEEYFAWPEIYGVADIAGTEHDIATNLWGGSWQMPSEAQFKELIDGCKIKYFYHSDSYELIFVADNGNYIRLESKGYKEPNSSYIYSSYGKYYWTSTASQEYRYYAKALYGEFQYLLYYKLGESDFDKVVRSYSVEMRMPIRAVTAK